MCDPDTLPNKTQDHLVSILQGQVESLVAERDGLKQALTSLQAQVSELYLKRAHCTCNLEQQSSAQHSLTSSWSKASLKAKAVTEITMGASLVPCGRLPPDSPHQGQLPTRSSLPTAKSTPKFGNALDLYKVERKLDKGTYGTVWLAHHVDGKGTVAIKQIHNFLENEQQGIAVLREVRIMRMLRHPNIVTFYGLLPLPPPGNSLLLRMQAYDTDLQKLLSSRQVLSSDHVKYILYQILCGLHYVHSANIMHRDLKPANILINGNCTTAICDFGLACVASDSITSTSRPLPVSNSNDSLSILHPALGALTTHVTTRWYRAPEVILLQPYTTSIDVWALGCIFAELLGMQLNGFRGPLFPGGSCLPLSPVPGQSHNPGIDQLQIIFNVLGTPNIEHIAWIPDLAVRRHVANMPQRADRHALRSCYPGSSEMALDLLRKMLTFDPNKRITTAQALQHPYFSDFRNVRSECTFTGFAPDFSFHYPQTNITCAELKRMIQQEIVDDNPPITQTAEIMLKCAQQSPVF